MLYDYIDIYAGCGGLSWGLKKAGWNGVFAIEKNEDAFATFKRNLIEKNDAFKWPNWLDKTNHDINDVLRLNRENLLELHGKISLVVGGPPCQGFSMAGKRDSSDSRNKLVSSYLKLIRLIKPKIVFFENVHGFTVGFHNGVDNEAPFSDKIVSALKRMGYKVEWKLIDISVYGVPQKRIRFILIGSLEADPKCFFDTLEKNRLFFLANNHLTENITVKQAIDDLQRLHGETECSDSKNYKAGTYGKINSKYQKLMRSGIQEDIKTPNSHRFVKHRKDTETLFNKIMQASDEPRRISPNQNIVEGLKKRGVTPLKPDFLCNTLTSIPDDYIHYNEPRVLTVREMARIQSFPDSFEFLGKYTTGGKLRKNEVPRYTQVANAIPPLFSEQVGFALKELIKFE